MTSGQAPAPAPAPALVACAHGTASVDGRRAIAALREQLAARRPDLDVLSAHVDPVQLPLLPEVAARLATAGRPFVVVPLLLATGYHVAVDVARVVAAHPGLARTSAPLGPDPVLADVLADRLRSAGLTARDAVVLVAAGSSDPRARVEVEQVGSQLADRLGRPVSTGYLSAATPTAAEAVAAARTTGRPVAVAGYLLSPGQFHARLGELGADRVGAALAPDPRLVDLVLQRYTAATIRTGAAP